MKEKRIELTNKERKFFEAIKPMINIADWDASLSTHIRHELWSNFVKLFDTTMIDLGLTSIGVNIPYGASVEMFNNGALDQDRIFEVYNGYLHISYARVDVRVYYDADEMYATYEFDDYIDDDGGEKALFAALQS